MPTTKAPTCRLFSAQHALTVTSVLELTNMALMLWGGPPELMEGRTGG